MSVNTHRLINDTVDKRWKHSSNWNRFIICHRVGTLNGGWWGPSWPLLRWRHRICWNTPVVPRRSFANSNRRWTFSCSKPNENQWKWAATTHNFIFPPPPPSLPPLPVFVTDSSIPHKSSLFTFISTSRLETKSCRISYPKLMVKYDRT